jgi:ubiquinone biosynthesis protein UbiJ
MITPSAVMERLKKELETHHAKALAVGASYKFELAGEGGGTWLVSLKDPVGLSEGSGASDCTLKLSAADFVDLFEGRVSGQDLFFEGRLQIDGDFSVALRLQEITELLRP